jgi:hypothetical protein
MKYKIVILIIFIFSGNLTSQVFEKLHDRDSIKEIRIEEVMINEKDYEKVEIDYGTKQEFNARFKPWIGSEMALKFKNNFNRKGIVKDFTLYLHKTDKNINLTDLEINFYEIDTITDKPAKKINNTPIIYSPKNKSRGRYKINIEDKRIVFPKSGLFIAIKWLPNSSKDKEVGPSIRLTTYTYENLTYDRSRRDRSWHYHGNPNAPKPANIMIGMSVYFKKKKQ